MCFIYCLGMVCANIHKALSSFRLAAARKGCVCLWQK